MNISIQEKEDLLNRLEKSLDEVRPFLRKDGGDVKLLDVTDDLVVQIELIGTCKSCQMSSMTMKNGIEESIRRNIPAVREVVAV